MYQNKINNREYNATQTNGGSCYTNLQGYGSIPGLGSIIVPPTPVTAVPPFGQFMKPYKMPNLNPRQMNCLGYKEMNNFCNTNTPVESYSFSPGFNDVSGYR